MTNMIWCKKCQSWETTFVATTSSAFVQRLLLAAYTLSPYRSAQRMGRVKVLARKNYWLDWATRRAYRRAPRSHSVVTRRQHAIPHACAICSPATAPSRALVFLTLLYFCILSPQFPWLSAITLGSSSQLRQKSNLMGSACVRMSSRRYNDETSTSICLDFVTDGS